MIVMARRMIRMKLPRCSKKQRWFHQWCCPLWLSRRHSVLALSTAMATPIWMEAPASQGSTNSQSKAINVLVVLCLNCWRKWLWIKKRQLWRRKITVNGGKASSVVGLCGFRVFRIFDRHHHLGQHNYDWNWSRDVSDKERGDELGYQCGASLSCSLHPGTLIANRRRWVVKHTWGSTWFPLRFDSYKSTSQMLERQQRITLTIDYRIYVVICWYMLWCIIHPHVSDCFHRNNVMICLRILCWVNVLMLPISPGGGIRTFWSCWFLLDFFLVCVGMLAVVVAPMLTGCWSFADCAPQKLHNTQTGIWRKGKCRAHFQKKCKFCPANDFHRRWWHWYGWFRETTGRTRLALVEIGSCFTNGWALQGG